MIRALITGFEIIESEDKKKDHIKTIFEDEEILTFMRRYQHIHIQKWVHKFGTDMKIPSFKDIESPAKNYITPISHFSKDHDETEFKNYEEHKRQIYLTEEIMETDQEYLDIKN